MCMCVCLYIYLSHNFFHLSVDGYLGYFHVLAIVNSAAMNITNPGFFLIEVSNASFFSLMRVMLF